jgi:hypothetical protein
MRQSDLVVGDDRAGASRALCRSPGALDEPAGEAAGVVITA